MLVVVGSLWLWRSIRHTDDPAPERREAGESAVSSTTAPPPSLPAAEAEPERPARQPVSLPPDAATVDPATMRHGLDEVHGRIRDAVATCFEGFAFDAGSARVAFRYQLQVTARRARIVEPQIYEASFVLGDSTRCFEEKLAALQWDTDLPDTSSPVQDELSGAEL